MRKKFVIEVEFDTHKDNEVCKKALTKGIYYGLDSATYHVAPPNQVKELNISEVVGGDPSLEGI